MPSRQPVAWMKEFAGKLRKLRHGNINVLRRVPESPVSVIGRDYAIFLSD